MRKFSEWVQDKELLVEVRVVCNSCGKESGVSNFNWNAGKARCGACGGSVEKKDEPAKPNASGQDKAR